MGNYTTYGSRDVGEATGKEQQHWPSKLAEAPNVKNLNSLLPADQKPHNCSNIQWFESLVTDGQHLTAVRQQWKTPFKCILDISDAKREVL